MRDVLPVYHTKTGKLKTHNISPNSSLSSKSCTDHKKSIFEGNPTAITYTSILLSQNFQKFRSYIVDGQNWKTR